MRIIFIRQQDYWIFPVSFISVFLVGAALYAGVWPIRLQTGLPGLLLLLLATRIIRKNYDKRSGTKYLVICLLSAGLGALAFHLLTN